MECLPQKETLWKRKAPENHRELLRQSYQDAINSRRLQCLTMPSFSTDRWHPYNFPERHRTSDALLNAQKLEQLHNELQNLLEWVPKASEWTTTAETQHLTPSVCRARHQTYTSRSPKPHHVQDLVLAFESYRLKERPESLQQPSIYTILPARLLRLELEAAQDFCQPR